MVLPAIYDAIGDIPPRGKRRERIGTQEKSLKETFHGYDTHRAVSLVNIETRYDKYLSEASVMKCILFELYRCTFFFPVRRKPFVR